MKVKHKQTDNKHKCEICNREFKREDHFKNHKCVAQGIPAPSRKEPAKELKEKFNPDDPFGFKAFDISNRAAYSMMVSNFVKI